MNFNIIQRESVVIEDVYDDVKNEYLNTNIPSEEIRTKYGLSHCDWRYINRRIKKEEGIGSRPSINAKYYYPNYGQFQIEKKIKGKTYHFGCVPTESIAKKIVALCKGCEWDITKCYEYVQNWEVYV